jgi:hypothetical protein
MLTCTICGKDLDTTSNIRSHFQTCNSRQITENIVPVRAAPDGVPKHEQHQRELCDLREHYEHQLCEQREQYERQLCELREYYELTSTSQSEDISAHKQEQHAFERSLYEYPWKLVRAMERMEPKDNAESDV